MEKKTTILFWDSYSARLMTDFLDNIKKGQCELHCSATYWRKLRIPILEKLVTRPTRRNPPAKSPDLTASLCIPRLRAAMPISSALVILNADALRDKRLKVSFPRFSKIGIRNFRYHADYCNRTP